MGPLIRVNSAKSLMLPGEADELVCEGMYACTARHLRDTWPIGSKSGDTKVWVIAMRIGGGG